MGYSVQTPTTSRFMYTAYPDIFQPKIDSALATPYAEIENSAISWQKYMRLSGAESKTYLNNGNATDVKDRTIKSYLISAHTTPGANAASVITIDPSSLGPAGTAPYLANQRHEFQVYDRVYIESPTGTLLQGKVTAVPAVNQVTVIGEQTGTDWGAAITDGVTKLYMGSAAYPSGSTQTRYGFFVGTTRTSFNLQIIRHSYTQTGTIQNSTLNWYNGYWVEEFTNDQWNYFQRMQANAHLLGNPNNQNATGEYQMTGVWYASDTNGTNYTLSGGGWQNLVLEDFVDYFNLHIAQNLGVKQWMGCVDTASQMQIDLALADWGLGNHLFNMGELNKEHAIKFGFKSYASGQYGIQWTGFTEFDNTESVFNILKGKMYLQPVGMVDTSSGSRPYVETLYLGARGMDRKVKFSKVGGANNEGDVATINDFDTLNFISEEGNLLRIQKGLGSIDGR